MIETHTHQLCFTLNIPTTAVAEVGIFGLYTDTRKSMQDGVFLALKGENFDGHDFIDIAEKMGAKAVIVSQNVDTQLPTLLVENTEKALVKIAKWWLHQIKPQVIGITGSNGKTTTKNMLANILNLSAPTLKTQGNLNNHLGVPMTLLKLDKKHRYAVIEMGANHVGEIAHLRNIANPDVALVTNTLDAHIGEFGGFDNLVKAKGEIYSLRSKNIINIKTTFTGDIYFGDEGNVFATNIKNNVFDLNIFNEKITVQLALLGKHNIENALAAAGCAYALGIDINTIKQGLENTQAEKGRLNLIQHAKLMIIDDTYNASPSSVKYALEVLNNFSGKKIAVLGQMAELGMQSQEYHAQVGAFAKLLDIEYLYSYKADYGVHNFNNKTKLLATLKQHTNATILFKGSRIAKLEQIIEKLCV